MKTISLKKVAVVAVASLGFGLLSVVPAQAATVTGTVTSINLKTVTTTPTQGVAVAVNMGVVLPAQSIATGNQMQFQAALTTVPAGGSTGITGSVTGMTTPTLPANMAGTAAVVSGGACVITRQDTTLAAANGAGSVTATTAVGTCQFSFTPQKAGTYVMTVWHDGGGTPDTVLSGSEVSQTVSITVAAAADLVPGATVAYMTAAAAGGAAAASATTNAIPRSGSKTSGTDIAQIFVDLKLSDGTDDDSAHTLTATVSGSGYVGINTAADTDASSTARVATNSSAQSERYVWIEADGTAGTGTVTLTVTHAVTGVTSTIGTWSYSTYGNVAKLEISSKIYTIGRAGNTTGAADADLAGRTLTKIPAFVVKMTDSNGAPALRGALPEFVSSNPAVITGGTCAIDDGSAPTTYSSSTNGVGFYNCNFDTALGAKSGDKATLTLRVTNPADTTTYLSTTIDLTVGGSVAKEVLTLNKTTYAPGEQMQITITATDSSGNPVYDGAATPAGVTSNKSAIGLPDTASVYVAGKKTWGALGGVYAPALAGPFVITTDGTDAAETVLTANASVSDANAGLLTQIDALNAKIVALNALIAKIMKKLGVK